MYLWCVKCNEYRKHGSYQWWQCTHAKHNMHGAGEQFNAEVEEQKKLIEDSKERGIVDESAADRLGVLMKIQKSDADPKVPAKRALLILDDSVEKYSMTADGDGKVYFWIRRKDQSYDAFPHDDEDLNDYILREYKKRYDETISRYAVTQAIRMHKAMGKDPSSVVKHTGKRVIKTEDNIWVDLRDPQNSIYRVTPDYRGPSLPYSPDMDILFNRDGGSEMPLPERREGDWLEWFAGHLRVSDDMKMLFKVHVCHLFCMWQETPFMMFSGPERSGKSFTAAAIKELVDPVGMDSASNILPKDENRLAMMLTKEQTRLFDNVSYISPQISDLLCQACTGGTHTIRELYTDNNMLTIPFHKMRILFTSISKAVVRAPDLASRTLFYDVPPGQVDRSKTDLEDEYLDNRPYILYAALDVVGRAWKEYESRKEHYSGLPTTTRMSDFERFGSAIAHVLGDEDCSSIKKYQELMQDNMSMMVADEPLVQLVEQLVDEEPTHEYFDLTRNFFTRLLVLAENDETIDAHRKDFPQSAQSVKKHMERLRGAFLNRGIETRVWQDNTTNAIKRQSIHIKIWRTNPDDTAQAESS